MHSKDEIGHCGMYFDDKIFVLCCIFCYFHNLTIQRLLYTVRFLLLCRRWR